MFSAVHSDRSGRVYVSADWAACAFDGSRTVELDTAIPLPEGATLVPLAREAEGLDRQGRARPIGASRWALGAVLPAGYTRTLHPAYRDEGLRESPLAPLPTAAVCADDSGALYVAAVPTAPDLHQRNGGPTEAGTAQGTQGLQARPGNRLARQLARCARDHACAGARSAIRGEGVAALPVSARANESPPAVVAPRARPDASPKEGAAFRPSAAEIAEIALAHFAAGGEAVSFGRACEGEPLTAVRLLEDAIARIRHALPSARVHLETNGSSASALRRLIEAGLGEVTIRLCSARTDTYDALHGPIRYRYTDVRASIGMAREAGARVTLCVLALPGLTDRASELDALAALAGDAGASVVLRDLGADARRAIALAPKADAPVGMDAAIARLLEAA
ncbi:MAG TPA: radical SAM protein [Candidatus Limnocylindria bacterium]|nr:radical SAM protein [Candidatus Limnocylindria bacterium]